MPQTRFQFGLRDILFVFTWVCLLFAAAASRSAIVFGVTMNVFAIVLCFSRPLAERLSIPSGLLFFPTRWMEWVVSIVILTLLNLLFWPSAFAY
jgi:hypothetical protein